MPARTTRIKAQAPKAYDLTVNSFKDGVITLLDEARLPLTAAKEAKNLMQYQDGLWGVRWGTKNYGASLTGPIAGGIEFVENNGDGTHTTKLLVIDNGVPKVSEDGGPWNTVGVVTYDADAPMCMLQYRDKVLLANGEDDFSYYDIATNDIYEFDGIDDPTGLGLTLGAGLATGSRNAYYQVTAVNEVGETGPSTEISIAHDKPRNEWSSLTDGHIDLEWDPVTDALRYNIYYSDASGFCVYLDSIEATATPEYRDNGSVAVNDFIEVPDANNTTGEIFAHMAISGNRIWMTKYKNFPQRVGWMGTGANALSGNPFYGGGYVDIEKGGREMPQWVGHFRDGRGTPLATTLTSDPDGNGSAHHIEIITQEIGDTQINIPAVYKASASVGTTSPRGVIESRSTLYYPTRKGWFTTGSKPQLLNVLSTDEISVNIRPSVSALQVNAMGGIAGREIDGKLFYAIPDGSLTNNKIAILDQEKRNWNPHAFDFGVKQFLDYTDSDGNTHHLGVPNDGEGNYLIEFSPDFKSDNGQPINTKYVSPLIHFDDDHTAFVKLKAVYLELGRPMGAIHVTISGTKKSGALVPLVSKTIQNASQSSNVGFSTFGFTSRPFTFIDVEPTSYAESSAKRRIKVNKLLNNYQITITTASGATDYALHQYNSKGRFVPTSDPTSWRT